MDSLFVATPVRTDVHAGYALGLARLTYFLATAGVQTFLQFEYGSYLPHQRNLLSRRFLDSGFDRLLFLDADVEIVDPADVLKLLASESGITAAKCLSRWGTDHIVDGLGCVMIRRDVFEKMIAADAGLAYRIPGAELWNFFGELKPGQGEDMAFHARARAVGATITVLEEIRTRHHDGLRANEWPLSNDCAPLREVHAKV